MSRTKRRPQTDPTLLRRFQGARSKPDAYFDPKAEDILSSYFLAAALGDLPITQVCLWVTEQVSQEPIEILRYMTTSCSTRAWSPR